MINLLKEQERQFYYAVGQRLKKLRKDKGISQQQVADLFGLTFQQVQKYEKGTNRMPLHRLISFCEIIDVKIYDIIPVDCFKTK